jgi:hypothetical protein
MVWYCSRPMPSLWIRIPAMKMTDYTGQVTAPTSSMRVAIKIISCCWCSAAMGKLPIPLAGHCVVSVTWNGKNAALGISSVLDQIEFRRSSFFMAKFEKVITEKV